MDSVAGFDPQEPLRISGQAPAVQRLRPLDRCGYVFAHGHIAAIMPEPSCLEQRNQQDGTLR